MPTVPYNSISRDSIHLFFAPPNIEASLDAVDNRGEAVTADEIDIRRRN